MSALEMPKNSARTRRDLQPPEAGNARERQIYSVSWLPHALFLAAHRALPEPTAEQVIMQGLGADRVLLSARRSARVAPPGQLFRSNLIDDSRGLPCQFQRHQCFNPQPSQYQDAHFYYRGT